VDTSRDLARLREVAQNPSLERAVEAVRELLGMDVAYTTRLDGREQAFGTMRGDGESFGLAEGGRMPFADTYCKRVVTGRLPNLIGDVRGDDRAASLALTEAADVGSFASVPLRFSDGHVHGTLCAAGHEAKEGLGYRELQFLHVFARIIADALEREYLTRGARELEIQAAAAETLIAAVHARDEYTAEHSQRVVEHAVAVARKLDLDEEDLHEIAQVAMLHDIGKIAIPDEVLRKPGPLDEEQWRVMRAHPEHGEALIRNTPGLDHLAKAIRAEHERWSGGGYPDDLSGEEIPVASRIAFVCDAYHAMTSDRPYRQALSDGAARAEIEAGSGTQFWPDAARALLEVLDEDPGPVAS
jgi:HD-GYP domain-containing protein (c-di-GMP phosphodiesterase class II)